VEEEEQEEEEEGEGRKSQLRSPALLCLTELLQSRATSFLRLPRPFSAQNTVARPELKQQQQHQHQHQPLGPSDLHRA